MTKKVAVLGDGGPSGSYVLNIHVTTPIQIALGTQSKYSKTDLYGRVVYLGSARGISGSSRLDQRLHRHATRTGSKPPHYIRGVVRRALFGRQGWEHLLADGKHYKWQIDSLLDHEDVVLDGITALQHPQQLNIEHSLAIRLDGDLHTKIIKSGLGASGWEKGFDHLLLVTDDDVWWRLLPVRMQALACDQRTGTQVTDLVESYLRGRYCLRRLTNINGEHGQVEKLSGHPALDELVHTLQKSERQRSSKLERLKKAQERMNREGKDSGILRLYEFPRATKDLIFKDVELASAIEVLRKAEGDQILEEVFSIERPQTRRMIQNRSRELGKR